MTCIAITNFFDRDQQRWGYALAVDSLIGHFGKSRRKNNQLKHAEKFESEKVFWGNNHLGLFQGSLFIRSKEEDIGWEETIKSLNNIFDNIQGNKIYDNSGILNRLGDDTSLIITKRFPRGVELYQVKPAKTQSREWKACKINSSTGDDILASDKSRYWTGPINGEFQTDEFNRVLHPMESQGFVLSYILEEETKRIVESETDEFFKKVIKNENLHAQTLERTQEAFLYFISPRDMGRVDFRNTGKIIPFN